MRIAIDIGGTFTDLVVAQDDGALHVAKVASTPDDPSRAVLDGLAAILARTGGRPDAVREVVHGTTVGSNTILQRTGARTILLTTQGFRDVLEIGRIRTPEMFNLAWEKPAPLVPRRFRAEVAERMSAAGDVVVPLDPAEAVAACRPLVDEGAEAIAVCFLHSHVNPAHEIAAAAALRAAFPDVRVCASCEVLPEIKEYERTSTTVVNAYLLPAMQTYLERLRAGLDGIGVHAPLQVLASNGGMVGARHAAAMPVFAVASGPAGGVTGAAALTRDLGLGDVIVFDMGGTTAKASIIENGVPLLVTEYEFRDGISSPSRFIKGGGYMLKVPAVDIAEVGAGGGSIAAIDAGGLLGVGPASAGADPGPACYGRGNDRPTVTDANMVLGLLNPVSLAGGSLAVDPALAEAAVRRHVAEPLGLGLAEAAHGIRQVANVTMARAIRSVTVERGRDPRDMAMIAFGGGGPLHAADVARLLGITRIVAPTMSGVFSAAGMLTADVVHDVVQSVLRPLEAIGPAWLGAQVAVLAAEGGAMLAAEGYDEAARVLRLSADLRYAGQSSDLTVPLGEAGCDPAAMLAGLAGRFAETYRATYGYAPDEPVEMSTLRMAAIGRAPRLDFRTARVDVGATRGTTGRRAVSFARGEAAIDTPLIARGDVGPEARQGPAIVESYDTTVVVPPGATFHADSIGNLIIDLPAGRPGAAETGA